jgi:hypothetical protein
MQFTIGTHTFARLSSAPGRYALAFEARAPRERIALYGVPGVTGSYVSRGGRDGTAIAARVRYVGASADALITSYEGALAAFRETPLTLTAPSGKLYTRCILQDARVLTQPAATGRPEGAVFMDAEFVLFSAAG